MPSPVAPGIVEVDLIQLWDNQNIETTWHYHYTGTMDTAHAHSICVRLFTSYLAAVSHFANNWQVLKAYVRDLASTSGISHEEAPVTLIEGTETGRPLPNNASFAVKRSTGLAGRRNRGRIYRPGMTDSDLSDANHVAVSRVSNWVTFYNDLMAAQLSDNAIQEVIYHRDLGTGTDVTQYTYTDLTVDSTRRRLPDHNIHH